MLATVYEKVADLTQNHLNE